MMNFRKQNKRSQNAKHFCLSFFTSVIFLFAYGEGFGQKLHFGVAAEVVFVDEVRISDTNKADYEMYIVVDPLAQTISVTSRQATYNYRILSSKVNNGYITYLTRLAEGATDIKILYSIDQHDFTIINGNTAVMYYCYKI
jgi:hypothetical protein